jgi:alkanesulfonate monooxygenase SsuD/methylene tetrahydromethanopterin reductase-like flavin-dependent oxidoreductase (luciferase family)
MRTLWEDDLSRYEGEFYSLAPTRQFPKPVQKPHPPIHFGGESDAALRRVADIGQGWYGFGLTPEETRERVQRLDALLQKRGRTRSEIEISVCPYMRETTRETVEQYAAAGVDRVILVVAARDEPNLTGALDVMAKTIVEPAGKM